MSLQAHFFYPINQEIPIFTENGFIETGGVILVIFCLLRCAQYAVQSRIKKGRCFWIASILVFFAVIRKELNHLPDLFVSSDFLFLGYSYDWWEDRVLLVILLIMVGLLIYSWRYFWAVLRRTPIYLYLIVAVLAVLQYMGENAILFPEAFGMKLEEITEGMTYAIALAYLWTFNLADFETRVIGILTKK